MAKFLLLMRGDQTGFMAMPKEEKKAVIQEHIDYSEKLEAMDKIVGGGGLNSFSVLLNKNGNNIDQKNYPFKGTKYQLSGFYIIEAADLNEALELAKTCPALAHGESVEVAEMGH